MSALEHFHIGIIAIVSVVSFVLLVIYLIDDKGPTNKIPTATAKEV